MPAANASCTFCDLIRGAAEVSVCYEDSVALAFMDIQPVNPGHVLVVPRRHYDSLADIPTDVALHLFSVAMQLEPAVRKVTKADGINIIVSSGSAAGQDVFHHHVHLIPRTTGDGFDVRLPYPESEMPNRLQLDACAARIIAASQDPMRARIRAVAPVEVAAD